LQPSLTDLSKSCSAQDAPGSREKIATVNKNFTALLITYSSSAVKTWIAFVAP
jgi:hypothetical protein